MTVLDDVAGEAKPFEPESYTLRRASRPGFYGTILVDAERVAGSPYGLNARAVSPAELLLHVVMPGLVLGISLSQAGPTLGGVNALDLDCLLEVARPRQVEGQLHAKPRLRR